MYRGKNKHIKEEEPSRGYPKYHKLREISFNRNPP